AGERPRSWIAIDPSREDPGTDRIGQPQAVASVGEAQGDTLGQGPLGPSREQFGCRYARTRIAPGPQLGGSAMRATAARGCAQARPDYARRRIATGGDRDTCPAPAAGRGFQSPS